MEGHKGLLFLWLADGLKDVSNPSDYLDHRRWKINRQKSIEIGHKDIFDIAFISGDRLALPGPDIFL